MTLSMKDANEMADRVLAYLRERYSDAEWEEADLDWYDIQRILEEYGDSLNHDDDTDYVVGMLELEGYL